MRKIKKMLMALFLFGSANAAMAQSESGDVFNYVLQKSENIINNPNASDFELKVNQFKVTALRYVPTAGIRIYGQANTEVMDLQAVYLNEFITKYFTAIRKTTADKERKDCIMKFVKATRNNPLYDDKDREATEAFVNDPGGFTPFSINVNWQKAVAEIDGENEKK